MGTRYLKSLTKKWRWNPVHLPLEGRRHSSVVLARSVSRQWDQLSLERVPATSMTFFGKNCLPRFALAECINLFWQTERYFQKLYIRSNFFTNLIPPGPKSSQHDNGRHVRLFNPSSSLIQSSNGFIEFRFLYEQLVNILSFQGITIFWQILITFLHLGRLGLS